MKMQRGQSTRMKATIWKRTKRRPRDEDDYLPGVQKADGVEKACHPQEKLKKASCLLVACF